MFSHDNFLSVCLRRLAYPILDSVFSLLDKFTNPAFLAKPNSKNATNKYASKCNTLIS